MIGSCRKFSALKPDLMNLKKAVGRAQQSVFNKPFT